MAIVSVKRPLGLIHYANLRDQYASHHSCLLLRRSDRGVAGDDNGAAISNQRNPTDVAVESDRQPSCLAFGLHGHRIGVHDLHQKHGRSS